MNTDNIKRICGKNYNMDIEIQENIICDSYIDEYKDSYKQIRIGEIFKVLSKFEKDTEKSRIFIENILEDFSLKDIEKYYRGYDCQKLLSNDISNHIFYIINKKNHNKSKESE